MQLTDAFSTSTAFLISTSCFGCALQEVSDNSALKLRMKLKCPPLTQLNGVFGVIKPHGITAAKTCNQIRDDLVRGVEAHLLEICYIIFLI